MACKECDDRDNEFICVRAYRARLFREGKLTKEFEELLDFEDVADNLCRVIKKLHPGGAAAATNRADRG